MSDSRQMRYDLETAARALRGSSWPGEMAQRMEEAAARIDSYADRVEKLRASLDAIKRLVVTTYGDNKVCVDARELDPSAYQSHEWFLHWSAEGWAHGPSEESGTLGEMLHGIASCYVDRGESTLLPPLIGEETEEERPFEVPFDDPLIDLFEAGQEDAGDGE